MSEAGQRNQLPIACRLGADDLETRRDQLGHMGPLQDPDLVATTVSEFAATLGLP